MKHKQINTMCRPVGYTHFQYGPYDLEPKTVLSHAGFTDAIGEFESQSCRYHCEEQKDDQQWCPAYVVHSFDGSYVRADLMVFDLPGISADRIHQWILRAGLGGLAYPSFRDSLMSPHCCLVLLLNRPVRATKYSALWRKIAGSFLCDRPTPEQADFRYRAPYPREMNGESLFLKSFGAALHVDFSLSLVEFDVLAAADYSIEHQDHAWMHWSTHRPK